MKYLVTGTQMKQIDRFTIEKVGIPSMVLMERAALAVAKEIEKRIRPGERIWCICGTGNNGADGIAAARILYLKGYFVKLVCCGLEEKGTEEYHSQLAIARHVGVPEYRWDQVKEQIDGVVADGIFGVGLSRPVEGIYGEILDCLEEKRKCGNIRTVVAIDLPSGICSDTGHWMGHGLKADVTVTFGYEKLGTALYPGKAWSGQVVVADIGFPDLARTAVGADTFTLEKADVRRMPERAADGNKGTFGKVLLIAGSKNMSGAAYFSALAAYRAGAGLVKILTEEENRVILQQQIPEAVLETISAEEVETSQEAASLVIREACQWADVVIAGPGLGTGVYGRQMTETILKEWNGPLVLDADALNVIAGQKELTRMYRSNVVITPHVKEFSGLCSCSVSHVKEHFMEMVKSYSETNDVIIIGKDAVTVAAKKGSPLYINSSGNSVMAKAGSGDVLAGIVGALVAQGMEPWDGAVFGVYLHGLAGDQWKDSHGKDGLLARELADQVGLVRKTVMEAAE